MSFGALNKLLWLDLETTGLDPKACKILEVACIVTDGGFNPLATFQRVIHWEPLEIDDMDAYVFNMHTNSGLLQEVRRSKQDLVDVECDLITFIASNFKDGEPVHLAGNSVHFDKHFIYEQMPVVHALLHHRILDVSSFKLFCNLWNIPVPKGTGNHRAMKDIESSIEEFKELLMVMSENGCW